MAPIAKFLGNLVQGQVIKLLYSGMSKVTKLALGGLLLASTVGLAIVAYENDAARKDCDAKFQAANELENDGRLLNDPTLLKAKQDATAACAGSAARSKVVLEMATPARSPASAK